MEYIVWYFFALGVLTNMYFTYRIALKVLRNGIRLRRTQQ